jgi:hypothetical protein
MFPKMGGAAFSLAILGKPDSKLCMELGAAILFDKPLILMVPDREMAIPANLKRVASAIIVGDPSEPAIRKQLQDALTAVLVNDARVKR